MYMYLYKNTNVFIKTLCCCCCVEYSSVLMEGLDEFPGLSAELMNLDSLCNWQGEIEDIDTDTLVR